MTTRIPYQAGALALALGLALSAAACGDDDMEATTPDAAPPGPDAAPGAVDFTVRIDNIAPWTVLKSGAQAMRAGAGTSGPLAPGEAFEVSFTAGKKQNLSFVAMLGESNDWFFAPGPGGIPLYDANGAPVSGDVTAQVTLWNAGTEIDEEPAVGASTGPKQSGPDVGAADPDPTVSELAGTITLSNGDSFTLPAIADMIHVTLTPGADRQFTLRVENVSTETTLHTTAGDRAIHVSPLVWALHIAPAPFFTVGSADRAQGLELVAESGRGADLTASMAALSGFATPLSPGVYALHRGGEPLFAENMPDRGLGLERIAESGNPQVMADAFLAGQAEGLDASGVFNVPVDAEAAGPAAPGHAYELHVRAVPGDRLSLATMFGMSNDWFFATPAEGLALFDAAGEPVTGDVTDAFALYDSGTEVDQELCIGPDTGPQQASPDSGAADPVQLVRRVSEETYGVAPAKHLRVTIATE
jgi:hypothetical protein